MQRGQQNHPKTKPLQLCDERDPAAKDVTDRLFDELQRVTNHFVMLWQLREQFYVENPDEDKVDPETKKRLRNVNEELREKMMHWFKQGRLQPGIADLNDKSAPAESKLKQNPVPEIGDYPKESATLMKKYTCPISTHPQIHDEHRIHLEKQNHELQDQLRRQVQESAATEQGLRDEVQEILQTQCDLHSKFQKILQENNELHLQVHDLQQLQERHEDHHQKICQQNSELLPVEHKKKEEEPVVWVCFKFH